MAPQIYLWTEERLRLLRRHDFYLEQIKLRVLSQFRNISDEAEMFAKDEYERLGALPGDGTIDMSDIAEAADGQGIEFYMLLDDLREQMILGALAGFYHQWEKGLRDFLERELRQSFEEEVVKKISWNGDIKEIFDLLELFGWDCRSLAFASKLEACGLVVNVYKHGKGRSLDQLAANFPEYLDRPLKVGDKPAFPDMPPDHEWLKLTEDQLTEFGSCLREFWVQFPERLFLNLPSQI